MTDRPPYLHDGETALEQRIGLIGEKIAHPLRAGPFGVVVVHARHDFADLEPLARHIVPAAQRMVEHDDARSAAFGFHQLFHFRIVDASNFLLVEEVGDFGVVTNEAKALAVELQVPGERAAIVDDDQPRVDRAAADVERARATRLGKNLHTVVDQIIQRRVDRRNGFRRGVPFEDLIHCQLLRTRCVDNALPQHKRAAELR